MYDGIRADAPLIHSAFPAPAMVAGYLDGRYAWTTTEWGLFPHAVHVEIAVFSATTGGDVIDCESGDATPAQAAAWVRKRKAAGYDRPTVYCSRSVVPAVRQATGTLALGRDYDIWVADYTNAAHQVAGCAATQYQNTAHWDVSAVYDDGWPHRKAPAVTQPPKSGTQDRWRWCHKCQSLFYGPDASQSRCPAGGPHDMTGSYNYSLPFTNS
jgi:hypothetical protein